ncbi:unnamed protein product [Gordionus sp. m RMFG-2023]
MEELDMLIKAFQNHLLPKCNGKNTYVKWSPVLTQEKMIYNYEYENSISTIEETKHGSKGIDHHYQISCDNSFKGELDDDISYETIVKGILKNNKSYVLTNEGKTCLTTASQNTDIDSKFIVKGEDKDVSIIAPKIKNDIRLYPNKLPIDNTLTRFINNSCCEKYTKIKAIISDIEDSTTNENNMNQVFMKLCHNLNMLSKLVENDRDKLLYGNMGGFSILDIELIKYKCFSIPFTEENHSKSLISLLNFIYKCSNFIISNVHFVLSKKYIISKFLLLLHATNDKEIIKIILKNIKLFTNCAVGRSTFSRLFLADYESLNNFITSTNRDLYMDIIDILKNLSVDTNFRNNGELFLKTMILNSETNIFDKLDPKDTRLLENIESYLTFIDNITLDLKDTNLQKKKDFINLSGDLLNFASDLVDNYNSVNNPPLKFLFLVIKISIKLYNKNNVDLNKHSNLLMYNKFVQICIDIVEHKFDQKTEEISFLFLSSLQNILEDKFSVTTKFGVLDEQSQTSIILDLFIWDKLKESLKKLEFSPCFIKFTMEYFSKNTIKTNDLILYMKKNPILLYFMIIYLINLSQILGLEFNTNEEFNIHSTLKLNQEKYEYYMEYFLSILRYWNDCDNLSTLTDSTVHFCSILLRIYHYVSKNNKNRDLAMIILNKFIFILVKET